MGCKFFIPPFQLYGMPFIFGIQVIVALLTGLYSVLFGIPLISFCLIGGFAGSHCFLSKLHWLNHLFFPISFLHCSV